MSRRIPLLLAVLLAAPLSAFAQQTPGPYVSLGAGVGFQQNEVALPTPAIGRQYNDFWSFGPGFSGQASIGYALGNGLRAEVEGDFLSNAVTGYGPTPTPRQASGTEQKYGGMVNVLYDVNLGLPVFPYFGVGIGGQIVAQNGFRQSVPGFVFPAGATGTGGQSVGAFAYQAIAGVAWPIAAVPGLSLTAEYRFLGIDDGNAAFVRHAYAETPSGPVQIGIGKTQFTNDFNHSILLGLRYALFPPPPPPPPVSASPAPAAVPLPAPTRTYLVFFDWDRADLTERARQIVAEAAAASARVQLTRIEVNGYTDASGTAAYNKALSLRRAQAVQAELVRDGVAGKDIAVLGFGEDHPLVLTAPGAREPQNRRVEIILH